MTIVTADPAMLAAFAGLKERVEVRDANGNILGYFTPRELEEELLYQNADKVMDPEEIRRRLAEPSRGFSIEQVMDYLKSLEKS
jgi:hypothetical protein